MRSDGTSSPVKPVGNQLVNPGTCGVSRGNSAISGVRARPRCRGQVRSPACSGPLTDQACGVVRPVQLAWSVMITAVTSDAGEDAAEGRVAQLAKELGDARQRGLADLDKQRGKQRRVAVPVLEGMAQRFGKRQSLTQRGRIFLIQQLLDDALTTYATDHSAPEAAFLRRLFEDGRGNWPGATGAGGLLASARQAEGLSETAFRDRQRSYLQTFAAYLLDRYDSAEAQPLTRRWALVAALIAGAVLVVGAAGTALLMNRDEGSPTGPGSSSQTPTTATGDVESAPASAGQVQFRFDSLGSTQSNVIQVYPGVTASDRDRTQNGTYYHGNTVRALCITTGRTVTSDPGAGEQPERSDQWVRIGGPPGVVQYAALTYGEIVPAGAELPACEAH